MPNPIYPADLDVSLPRIDRGEDPADFIWRSIRQGYIVLASVYVTNLNWWEDERYGPSGEREDLEQSYERHSLERISMVREAAAVARGNDIRSTRLRYIYSLGTSLPISEQSPSFYRFVGEQNRPLYPPTFEKLAVDCRMANSRAREEGEDQESYFHAAIDNNGAVRRKPMFSSHAVVITGYNDQDSTFEFRNSWGTDWKDRGYAYMSYDYLRRFLQSYWQDELPIAAYRPDRNGTYHTSGHPLDGT